MCPKLSYCSSSCTPEIPGVDDVLFIMRLLPDSTDEDRKIMQASENTYWFCAGNSQIMIRNALLVAAEVTLDLLLNWIPIEVAREVVARAIVHMAPEEAQYNHEVATAKRLVANPVVLLIHERGDDGKIARTRTYHTDEVNERMLKSLKAKRGGKMITDNLADGTRTWQRLDQHHLIQDTLLVIEVRHQPNAKRHPELVLG